MEQAGGDLFIVDNSVSGWTGLKYLEQWTEISTGFDIATGYFEVGALLVLDGHWQKLKKIRILMGDETTRKTKRLLAEALKQKAEKVKKAEAVAEQAAEQALTAVDMKEKKTQYETSIREIDELLNVINKLKYDGPDSKMFSTAHREDAETKFKRITNILNDNGFGKLVMVGNFSIYKLMEHVIGTDLSKIGIATDDIDGKVATLESNVETEQVIVDALIEEKMVYEKEFRKLEAEVGPVKYIAELVYGEANKSVLEDAVRWVIIILCIVFDPLAVALLIAWNGMIAQPRRKIPEIPESIMNVSDDARYYWQKIQEDRKVKAHVDNLPEKREDRPGPSIAEKPKEVDPDNEPYNPESYELRSDIKEIIKKKDTENPK